MAEGWFRQDSEMGHLGPISPEGDMEADDRSPTTHEVGATTHFEAVEGHVDAECNSTIGDQCKWSDAADQGRALVHRVADATNLRGVLGRTAHRRSETELMCRRSPVVYSMRNRKRSRGSTPRFNGLLAVGRAVYANAALMAMTRAGDVDVTVRIVS